MNALRAEIGKLLTLPSLWITALLTLAVTLLLRALDLPGSVLVHTQAGLLVFGVLAATHEYQGGGQIRTTLLALPRRLPLAMNKALALTIVAAPLAATTALLGGDTSAALPLTASMLLAAGIGGLLRQAVAGVGVVLTAYLIACPLLRARWPASDPWLPDTALLDQAQGLPGALVWTAATLGAAAFALHSRDA
ncbi:hypothetical protein AB0F81_05735 [Actinoplanes sp. NPDC024001]|uniref:hypothetical protein n=1 Tax=Actinoplanes sp. NPDC024001 TaxID=3154598 RepID=UPI0033CF7227